MAFMKKLTRAQVKEGLKFTTIDQILVGAHNVDKVNLTKKQKDFAKAVALGTPKAQAYRNTYNTQSHKDRQASDACKLAQNPKVAQMIESFKVSNAAREYLIPSQIRTMAIQNLVSIAINEDEKTSNKLKALELIGKMSEVSLFTETKTHVHLHSSLDIRAQLVEGLKTAFINSKSLSQNARTRANELLAEIEYTSDENTIDADETSPAPLDYREREHPPPPVAQNLPSRSRQTIHSIPHNESQLTTIPSDIPTAIPAVIASGIPSVKSTIPSVIPETIPSVIGVPNDIPIPTGVTIPTGIPTGEGG